ncbi:hypothetical protein PSECIP111951_04191 [Pseudoalteromonas holothuriae]|uniref:Tail fiber protein n=1 Tax=Pseudoalteromonas holothuriae TaxID=2963714 RepID=A0ABM9GNT2_9GAMM|nr:hypothetical protein PSECIP111951_04191 [Pseudoalteromonas sp. CIP111951]
MRYGADKLFGNQASWNFGNVAVDAFGNAIGNSIVNHHVESAARQKYISETGQKLSANTQAKVNQQAAKNLNQTLADAQTNVNATTQSTLGMLQASQRANADAQFAAAEARRVSRQQGVVDSANGLSASLSSQASALENRHLNQMTGIRAGADAAFAKGVARGEAMYAAGVRNREQIGVDFLKGVDVGANITWTEAQRAGYRANFGLDANTPMGSWRDVAWGATTKFIDVGSQFLQGAAQLITQGPAGVYMNGGFETHSFLGNPTTLMEASGRFMGEMSSYVIAPEAAIFGPSKLVHGLSHAHKFSPPTAADYQRIISRIPGRVIDESAWPNLGVLGKNVDVNNINALNQSLPATFSGGRYATIELTDELTLYRAWSPDRASEFGAFWSFEKPGGSLQTRLDSALRPEWGRITGSAHNTQATHWTSINVPSGTTIHAGQIANQGGAWNGGLEQILINASYDQKQTWFIRGGRLK